jgi:hypothetical protein
MSNQQNIRDRLASPLSADAPEIAGGRDSSEHIAEKTGNTTAESPHDDLAPKPTIQVGAAAPAARGGLQLKPFFMAKWLLNDVLFIGMLSLTLVGVVLRLPVVYWIILTPIFGVISIAEGWSQFASRSGRVWLACSVAAIWSAVLMCIYLLYSSSVQGVLNANSSSLAMMTVIALGTFVAGVQARVWQICGVGALLFLAVPGVGWLDQSPLLLAAVASAILLLGGLVWWIKQVQSSPGTDNTAQTVAPSTESRDASSPSL